MERYATRKLGFACDCQLGELLPKNAAENEGEEYLMACRCRTGDTTFLGCDSCGVFKIVHRCDELTRDDCRCEPVKLSRPDPWPFKIYLPCFTQSGCCGKVTVTVYNAAALFVDEPDRKRTARSIITKRY